MMRYVVTFFLLFINWVIWSGMFDAFHLSLGVIACSIVTYTTHDLLFKEEKFSAKLLREALRFVLYLPWLIYQIVIANLHVAFLALSPKMPIDPQLVRFKSGLKKEISLVTLGNSITLTPGTITADIVDGEFYVHALSKKTADDLMTGDMEKRVAHIFEEDLHG
jgi:multicomponent Na+:H+ antiporter subunit E